MEILGRIGGGCRELMMFRCQPYIYYCAEYLNEVPYKSVGRRDRIDERAVLEFSVLAGLSPGAYG